MATQWGRKETIIWPPHVPMLSYTAVATALLCTCLFVWQRFTFSMSPLQRSYMTEYIRSQVGATFNAHEGYRLLYLGGGKSQPRLAFPVDFVPGKTALPDGKIVPVALSELASLQGYRWFYRGSEQKLPDVSLHRWLRQAVYEDEGLLRLFAVTLIEGGVCLVAMLWFAVPRDIKRFKQLKYGRILRGPQLLSPEEFNKQQKGDGIGFKTTELGKMMRIPLRKEAQHFQIMGDTGVGKTQLIMQILRQIRERGDSAIIYDPACEYLQRFYDRERGDIVLNPLDERCPYWGPAQEMASNAEAMPSPHPFTSRQPMSKMNSFTRRRHRSLPISYGRGRRLISSPNGWRVATPWSGWSQVPRCLSTSTVRPVRSGPVSLRPLDW